MIFRTAKPAERKHIQDLWRLAFYENEDECAYVFDTLCEPHEIFICEDECGIPVSMICAVSISLGGRLGVYLYGINTHPNFRGRGIFCELLDYTKHILITRGVQFACLVPASAELFNTYGRKGFDHAFMLRAITLKITGAPCPHADFKIVNAEVISALRAKFAGSNYISFSPEIYTAFADYWNKNGAVLATSDKAYGIYFVKRQQLLFRELFAANTTSAAALIAAAGRLEGKTSAVCQTATFSNLFADSAFSRPYPYGLLCFLQQPFITENMYMNLMFD